MNDFRPQRFEILPNVIKNLLIINGLFFLTKMTFGIYSNDFIYKYLALHSIKSDYFKLYQLITYLFIHSSFTHLFFNMFALWTFGAILENIWGAKKFLTFYLLCGIGGGLLHLAFMGFSQNNLIHSITPEIQSFNIDEQNEVWEQVRQILNVPTVGASGAVFGCLAAFGYLFPNTYLHIYFFIPVKAKWFVSIYILSELVYLLMSQNGGSTLDNIARVAHLGGALIGFLIVYIDNKRNRNSFY